MSNDPSRKLKGMSGIMIALAVIGLFVGFVLLNGARGSEESISAWTVMVSSIVFLFFSISAYFAASCVEYRNDLIREQNELLKKQEARVIKKEFEEAKLNGNTEKQHMLLDALFSYSLWAIFELAGTDVLKEISAFVKENDYI